MDSQLSFTVGQEAESMSFMEGFRSAWFRCKIKRKHIQKGHIGYNLEFFDFPDEKVTWTKLYQKPPWNTESPGDSDPVLMVRPSFPPYFRESESPDSYPTSDVVAIIEDNWEVGDLVDWSADGCFWSGRVVQILENGKVKVELPEPPIGEGNIYEAFSKDLRPSLSWSPENGWTVPLSRDDGFSMYAARLVQPFKQDEERVEDTVVETSTERNDLPKSLNLYGTGEKKQSCERSNFHDERRTDVLIENVSFREWNDPPSALNLDGTREEKQSCERSSFHDNRREIPIKDVSSRGQCEPLNFQEVPSRESRYITSLRHSDTVESAIMELEELANKIRWLKGLLQFGFRWSNAMKPAWKILENCG